MRRLPVKTALVGLLVAPAALAQQNPQQPAEPPKPDPNPQPPNESTPAQPSGAPATMQTVTVTGTKPSDDFLVTKPSLTRLGADNIMDIPQTVIVVNKALMQSQGATTLEGALRNVPGVTIGSAEGGTIGTNINLNGFSARTDIYLDGMRDRGQYYRDVFALEAIEVLMGPSSMLFGRGSTGGVINQVTKKPTLQKATELQVMGTTNGLVRGTADMNVPFGPDSTNAARVNGMFQYGKTMTIDNTQAMDFGFAPQVKLGIGTPTEITLQAILQHRHDNVPYGVPNINGYLINVPRNTSYGFADDYTNQDVVQLNATVDHKFNQGLSLRNQTAFIWVNTDVRETSGAFVGTLAANGGFVQAAAFPGSAPFSPVPPTALWIRQISRDRNINDYTLENQTELNAKFDTGFIGHQLLLGLDLEYEAYTNKTFTRTGNCNGVALPAGSVGCTPAWFTVGNSNPNNIPEVPGNYASSQAWAMGVYANDTVQVMPWLKLVGGVRYDIYASQVGNSLNFGNTPANTTNPYLAQTDTFTSVRTGAIFEPTKQQSYYVSYSTSFNPSLEQLTVTTGGSTLPPETNEAYEAGVKYDLLNNNLSLTGAVFQITKYNARTQNADGTFTPTGNVQVQGFRTGVAGQILPGWQVFGGWQHMNATIIQGQTFIGGIGNTTGKTPLNVPQDTASMWSTYTWRDTWEVGGGAFYVGQRWANNQNTVTVPGYVRFDMTAAWKQPKYEIRANVLNLTNTMYYDAVMGSDGGRGVPGSGTTGLLTLTYRM